LWKSKLLLSVAVFPGCAFCQGDEHRDDQWAAAAEHLHAASPKEKAWGAHLAAACRLNNLSGEIATELNGMHPDTSGMSYVDVSGRRHLDYSWWAAEAMLDALIQLDQPLDASALASIYQMFPTEATILMLQDIDRHRALLAEVRNSKVPHSLWLAASNALARIRVPRYAAILPRELRLTNRWWISDTGSHTPKGSPGGLFASNSIMEVPPEFPPVAMYWLTTEHGFLYDRYPASIISEELASAGPTPSSSIYTRRILLEPGVARLVYFPTDGFCRNCQRGCPECQTERLDYLAELAGVSAADVVHAVEPLTQVAWSNNEDINAAVRRAVAEQVLAVRQLVKALIATGALRRSELQMTLKPRWP
jgi:hypothetical protein